MVTGAEGGRTIISTVLHTILNVIDHGMNAQEAVDAARFYHQWLPDTVNLRAERAVARHPGDPQDPRPHAQGDRTARAAPK